MTVNSSKACPRCHEREMRTWDELSDDEREVVRRLPASADYTAAQRQATHQWCTRCWYEAANHPERRA
jgi:hypothetical protein